MVHALELAGDFLHPDGRLINVQGLPAPHVVEVRSAEAIMKAGWLTDRDDFDTDRSALDAITRVVAEGRFTLDDERDFSVNLTAENLAELQQWLAEWWTSAVFHDRTIRRVEDLVRIAGQSANVVVTVPARMTKLIVT